MKVCTNFKDRLIGLMFKKHINEEYIFPNCKSVHTFFMKTNIDIIALNKNAIVIKNYKNVKPNKIIFAPKDTYYILETNTYSKYKIGDRLIIEKPSN